MRGTLLKSVAGSHADETKPEESVSPRQVISCESIGASPAGRGAKFAGPDIYEWQCREVLGSD
jgi:hypothetical protein